MPGYVKLNNRPIYVETWTFSIERPYSVASHWHVVMDPEKATTFKNEDLARYAMQEWLDQNPTWVLEFVPIQNDQPPGMVVPTSEFPTKERIMCEKKGPTPPKQEERKDVRSVQIMTLDGAIENIPVAWEEYGGADSVRYTVRKAELQNLLLDMVEKLEEIEMDARYCLEDAADAEWFTKSCEHARFLQHKLASEAKAIREVMGY